MSSARNGGGTSSFAATQSTIAQTKSLPSTDRKLSDYEVGYSAGYTAGFAAAKTAIANGEGVAQPNQLKPDERLKEPERTSSCRLPRPAPVSEADVAKKWDDSGKAESDRLASFKTPESYEKQKAYFAKVVAREKANPTPVAYKEKFTQTFGWKGEVGGPRDRKAPQPIALPWNPAALPNATNPAANGPPPRRSAVPPHLRKAKL
ncbi:hypothetical protein HII31_05884 [Pseudocercospora fuligena]|uniref:Uncharacterized protein n=1 Tax=Pseudocercospora fuligena TaxID=685502 RepID=A0A8H6VN43_9PEZI|nr:hypothetical protein HII31_05884 [Pseudocercospora fuligena]